MEDDALKSQLQAAFCEPEVLEIISKAVAAQVATHLRKEIGQLRTELQQYKAELEKRDNHIELLQDKVDELEQYSRRNSIRINNIPEKEGEDTEEVVKAVGRAVGIDFTDAMIDRAHRVGRKAGVGETYDRAIICKFTAYRYKRNLMMEKKKLSQSDPKKLFSDRAWPVSKGPVPKLFINDDLTQERAKIAAKARTYKREKTIEDTWVRDGVVFVKMNGVVRRITELRCLLFLVQPK
ncbi:uncharacterized protein [Littorina saxatilis]|uniref:uncharacterized protein n=1 Tax=Littorina saxatilis TaxID=31220 RepID=UPI0038B4F94F